MSVFTYSQVIKDNVLYIPPEYRAIFGWYNGLELYVTSLRPHEDDGKDSNEIILTPIDPRNRLDVWRLQLSFTDRRGLLKDLTTLLKDLGVDIISSKVSSSDQGRYIHVDMLLDNQLYRGFFDKDTSNRKRKKIVYLDELKNLLVGHFINEILFVTSTSSIPAAKIKRCLPLYRSYEFLDRHGHNSIEDGKVIIPTQIINDIRERYTKRFPKLAKTRGKNNLPRVSLVAEFEAHLIRAFVYFKDTDVLHMRVKGKNEVGAISKMCKLIDECGFNISQMNNRVLGNGLWSLSDFLLNYERSDKETETSDSRLQKRLKSAFAGDNSGFKFKVTFPKTKQLINGNYK